MSCGTHTIIYGPSGTGKYSSALKMVNHSASKKEKCVGHITLSDVHYEMDASFLSLAQFTESLGQIDDMVNAKPVREGVILLKNFGQIGDKCIPLIHVFMKEHANIKIIIITENYGFIPSCITEMCRLVQVKRLTNDEYMSIEPSPILENLAVNTITNIKELRTFRFIKNGKIPLDVFNVICDSVIQNISSPKAVFRECVYDILTYGLYVSDCIWYIFSNLVNDNMDALSVSNALVNIFTFFKQISHKRFSVYHIECIILQIACATSSL